MRGIINIVIGLALIAGGLSGGLVLRGINSGVGLAAIGVFFVGLGIFRLARRE